ncbi:MAG: hypothetical protein FWG12_06870 [Holophagaceae bacterium]|nr:hypothetical protein [Holophagaceae bacterium]
MATQTYGDTTEIAARICRDPEFVQSLAVLISKHTHDFEDDWLPPPSVAKEILQAREDLKAGRIQGIPHDEVRRRADYDM